MKNVLFLLFFASISQIMAQNIGINPLQTEASGVMPKGNFQIELGFLHQKLDYNIDYLAAPTLGLGYGLSNTVELQFAYQYDTYKSNFFGDVSKYNRWSDINLGAKFQLLNKEEVNTQIAFLTYFTIPASNDELSGDVGIINKLSIAHSISKKWEVVYNLGYDYVANTNVLNYSLALGYEISSKFGIYVESYGFYDDTEVSENYIDFGLSFYGAKNIGLDLTYGVGMNVSTQFLAGRFTWDFPTAFQFKKSN